MRVALFSDAVPPRLDGVAVTVARLVGELTARGHEVALIGPGPFDETAGASLHVRLPGFPLPSLPGLYGAAPRLGAAAKRALDQFRPEVVHALTEMPVGLAGRQYAMSRDLLFVTSAHTDYPAYLRHWGAGAAAPAMSAWMNWFHRAARVTLCPSRSYLERLRARGHRGPLRIWSRGVDAERFSPAHRSTAFRERLGASGRKIVLSVGRVVPEKRFDRLIGAFAEATRRSHDAVLVIVGVGASRRALEARAPPGVVFLGALRGHALAEAYASSDLFALASEEETFGNVVLEAMASGLPPVVPRAGALSELVNERTGALVDVSDSGAMARALGALIRDDGERAARGRAARLDALDRSWAKATDEVLSGYRFALGS
ncbi:MAG: glycosyltransferase family 1 protein [Polyangiales bacterium]